MKTGNQMTQRSKQEYFRIMHSRYRRASLPERSHLLDEVCQVCGYHRKHAIRKLNQPVPDHPVRRKPPRRGLTYEARVVGVLKAVWEAAGYPWSVRLKALLPLWEHWIDAHFRLTTEQ